MNTFIKDLITVECEVLGVKSKARRPIEFKEFLPILKLIRKKGFNEENQSMRGQLKWVWMFYFLSLQ